MNEVCFCGWSGAIEDRWYVQTGVDTDGLACPNCARIDDLHYLPELSRRATLDIAKQQMDANLRIFTPLPLRITEPAA